jgi:hypothetical protein
MQRIHDATAAAALPAPPTLTGPIGYFTGGVPGAVTPTIVRDWWLNMIQEELLALLTAAGIAPDTTGTNFTQVLAAIRAITTGESSALVIHQMFQTSGTYTPAGAMRFVAVESWGGGGGGGGAYGQPAYNVSAATGGASGAYSMRLYSRAEIGANAAITIGAGGSGGAAGQANGNAGGATIFAPAGLGPAGTMTAGGGGGGPYGITAQALARGQFLAGAPIATGGHINAPGIPGSWPLLFGGVTTYQAISGSGGHAPFLGTGGGQPSEENAAGNLANYFGGGGGGGAAMTVNTAGGAGFQGLLRVMEYCFG